MTIISHKLQLIYLRTRKTAGTSIQAWLLPHLGRRDIIAADPELWPISRPFFSTPSATTPWVQAERRLKSHLGGSLGIKRLRLHYHASASEVRATVGRKVWERYRKITVVRDPWDEMISRWWFAQKLSGQTFSMDDFLNVVEAGDHSDIRFSRPNWPVYTIDDEVVADTVIRYEDLRSGLEELAADLRIQLVLPKRKAGIRLGANGRCTLGARQVERIALLYKREIAQFGYVAPVSTLATT